MFEVDEFYVPDLIGLTVINQLNRKAIGKVINIIFAGNDLLEVEKISTVPPVISEVVEDNLPSKSKRSRDTKHQKKNQSPPSKKILIPFVKEIVPIVNFEQSIIEINPPDGLIDL